MRYDERLCRTVHNTEHFLYNWQHRPAELNCDHSTKSWIPKKDVHVLLYVYICLCASIFFNTFKCAHMYMCAMQYMYNTEYTAKLGTWTGASKCVKTAVSKESLASPDCRLPMFPRDSTSYNVVHYWRGRNMNLSWGFNMNVLFKERCWWYLCLNAS